MNKRELQYFNIIEKDVVSMGYEMTEARTLEVETVARDYTLMETLDKETKEKGTVQYTHNGYGQTAPWFTNRNKLRDLIIKHWKELGFYKDPLKVIPEKPETEEENLFND